MGTEPESPEERCVGGHAEGEQHGTTTTWTARNVSIAIRAPGQDQGVAPEALAPPATFKAPLRNPALK